MATTDKHPPAAKPKYKPAAPIHKARTDPYFGTVVRKAEGAKTLRPSDERVVREQDKAYETQDMVVEKIMKRGVIPMMEIMGIQKYYRRKMKYYETY